MNPFIKTITSSDPEIRNRSFSSLCIKLTVTELIKYFKELDDFRKTTPNLYERVRASIFLYAGYRFFLMENPDVPVVGKIPVEGYENLLKRNFEKSISIFQEQLYTKGADSNLFSCLAESYHHLTFQILADQVRKSVRSSKGNQWMFRVGHYDEHPLKIHPRLLQRQKDEVLFPLLQEKTPVRMDLTHSGWSDIFFLGMDYPEGARVINVSIDLGVYSRDNEIKPPLESYLRVITEPVIRITSLDLKDSKDITELSDLFNFGNDYLSLLKAAIIASGFIPPSFEGTNHTIKDILERILSPGLGIELVTKVNDIPKGSRLAVSTNLLASMISALMRATRQTTSLEGMLTESERRLIASRAILGEWIGGSGGGWQDSGGVWTDIKRIEGTLAVIGDPEWNVSRGCLLPKHTVLTGSAIHPDFEKKLTSSLVLMHGGMASNVGPILEMVTEKYLLRSEKEWIGRQKANKIYDDVLEVLKKSDIQKLASYTSENFDEPIKTIIPWATTHFTETIIAKAKKLFGSDYWGFLMLGGMSGGGMGMFVNPSIHAEAKETILKMLCETKDEMCDYMPFAMTPVVYNFNLNHKGSAATLLTGLDALMPGAYYALHIPRLVRQNPELLPDIRKAEIDIVSAKSSQNDEAYPMLRSIVGNLFKFSSNVESVERQQQDAEVDRIKRENGFDFIQHEQIRQDLFKGRIGLSRNRLPSETVIEDVSPEEVFELNGTDVAMKQIGEEAISAGKVAVLCLAGGVGSRWTKGAGVIKAINPFIEMSGQHRSFLEIHLAKNQKTAFKYSGSIPFIVATSYLTHQPIEKVLNQTKNFGYRDNVYLSPGKSIGQRFIPMERDLRFLWEEMPQEQLDENKQKVRDAVRATMINWAREKGESSDYIENISQQRLSPLGHWYEVSNMLRNGALATLLNENPNVDHIMLHNIDTLGADVSPEAIGRHITHSNALTFEVVPRRMEDRGGGLARINGKVRLLEGLAQPHEEDELSLSYYSTMTTWINIDKLLTLFGLTRKELFTANDEMLAEAVRKIARRMPTYVTIKDVKYRWGHGQEDIYPVAQIEKLWGDMSALSDMQCGYLVVPRLRGQQMKDPAQLDGWVTDGSKDYIASLCEFM
ncbi:MAG: UTP--glucose-1-phosphate uridylyltransferase [Bacteroidetes bacterium]|nr:UTP--glucose-1-phosphate uridylyltransferase [Bacteroidota bacterium]